MWTSVTEWDGAVSRLREVITRVTRRWMREIVGAVALGEGRAIWED
jgi:hypothetical protein